MPLRAHRRSDWGVVCMISSLFHLEEADEHFQGVFFLVRFVVRCTDEHEQNTESHANRQANSVIWNCISALKQKLCKTLSNLLIVS